MVGGTELQTPLVFQPISVASCPTPNVCMNIESESGLNNFPGTSLAMFTDIPRQLFFSVKSLQYFTHSGTVEFL